MRNFDSAGWDREKQRAVLSGNYAKITQNPAMKHHLVSTGNQRLAESSPLDSVWGIGFRADDHRANDSLQWRGKVFLVEALSALREAIRERDTGLANPACSGRFRTPTGKTGIHEISSAP